MRFRLTGPLALLVIFILSCGGETENVLIRAGGDTSVNNRTSFGFEDPAANLSEESLEKHLASPVT